MPAAHYVHPEFGLLCPTPRLRRKLRSVFACMILALIGGAVLRAANTPPSATSSSVMTVAGREESAAASLDAGQAPAASLNTRPSLAADAETGALKSACEQGSSLHRTWAYLDGKCVAGKTRKPRKVRIETDRPAIAAIAIGRIAAPERAGEPASSAASVPTGPPADALKSTPAASAEVAAAAEPPPRPAAASKKPQKRHAATSAGASRGEPMPFGGARCAPTTGVRGFMASATMAVAGTRARVPSARVIVIVSVIMGVADMRVRALSASSDEAARPQPSSYVRRSRYSAPVRRTNRETDMPEIYVHAVKGRSLDQKRALIKDITDAVVKNFSVPAEAVMVEIVESEPTAKAKGGVLFSEMRR